MKHYIACLKYILEHKKNVFETCWKNKLYLHAFTHDLSKFSPKEFFAYAKYFYLDKEKYKEDFENAWKYHYRNNRHHWNYWVDEKGNSIDIPRKYLKQMIADWEGMALKFGDTAQEHYLKRYIFFDLTYETRMELEHMLGINESMYHNHGHTLEDLIKLHGIDWWNRNYGFLKEKYGVDLLKVLKLH